MSGPDDETAAENAPPPEWSAPYGQPTGQPYGQPGLQDEPPRPVMLYSPAAIQSTSRLKVLVRFILAIPCFIVLLALTIAAQLTTIASWFAALFTARVPEGMYRFVSWVTAYNTRVTAYVLLLTDTWPWVSDDTEQYPVLVRWPGSLRLNRAAVFFRIILDIPARLLTTIIGYGLAPLLLPFWVIVLVMGRVPSPMFNALALVHRYSTRYTAYIYLLTAAYPAGLFGEVSDEAGPNGQVPPEATPGAKRLLVAFCALGVIVPAAIIVIAAVSSPTVNRVQVNNKLVSAYNSLDLTPLTTCAEDTSLTCLHQVTQQNSSKLSSFADTIDSLNFPSDTKAQAASLHTTVVKLSHDYSDLSRASSAQQFQAAAAADNIAGDSREVDAEVQQLNSALRNG